MYILDQEQPRTMMQQALQLPEAKAIDGTLVPGATFAILTDKLGHEHRLGDSKYG